MPERHSDAVTEVSEILYDAAEAFDYTPSERKAWVRAQLEDFWAGRADEAIADLHILQMATDNYRLQKLFGYATRFADAIDYQTYKDNGWTIGSGEVESTHRFIPQERLKLPGAWWHPNNVNPTLALRVVRANLWWTTSMYGVCTKGRLSYELMGTNRSNEITPGFGRELIHVRMFEGRHSVVKTMIWSRHRPKVLSP